MVIIFVAWQDMLNNGDTIADYLYNDIQIVLFIIVEEIKNSLKKYVSQFSIVSLKLVDLTELPRIPILTTLRPA